VKAVINYIKERDKEYAALLKRSRDLAFLIRDARRDFPEGNIQPFLDEDKEITNKINNWPKEELELFQCVDDWELFNVDTDDITKLVPAYLLHYFFPKLKTLKDIGVMDD